MSANAPAESPTRLADNARLTAAAVFRRLPAFKGKTRLMSVCDKLLKRSDAMPVVVTVAGARFVVDTRDHIDFKLMYGIDTSVADFLVNLVADDEKVIWDVGANVGAVALALTARCPRARVIAIEASPAVGRRLSRNIEANPELATRILHLPIALSDRTGETEFYESAEYFNSGVGRLEPAPNTRSQACRVRAWCGDDLIAAALAPPPDVIKIDIEGFEEPALRGMTDYLSRSDCHIVFEHEPYRLATPNNPPSPVQFLRQHGYSVRRIDSVQTPLGDSLPSTHTDLVAFRDTAVPGTLRATELHNLS